MTVISETGYSEIVFNPGKHKGYEYNYIKDLYVSIALPVIFENNLCVIKCGDTKYIDPNNANRCLDCPQFSIADPSTGACVCQSGYGYINSTCILCTENQYKNEHSNGHCMTCATGKYSLTVGATSDQVRLPCSNGDIITYLNTQKNICVEYPTNSEIDVDIPFIPQRLDCKCNSGYTIDVFEQCSPCTTGKYKMYSGNEPCTKCPDSLGYTLPGAMTIDNCTCLPEYTKNSHKVCVPCEVGRYKTQGGPGTCILCPEVSRNNTLSCKCVQGYTCKNENELCYEYPVGKFKNNNEDSTCNTCKQYSTTAQAASTTTGQCVCNKGYYTHQTLELCYMCIKGKYKDSISNDLCDNCVAGSYGSFDVSSGINVCDKCPAGTFSTKIQSLSQSECIQCVGNTYTETTGSISCMQCPENTVLGINNIGINSCIFNLGFFGPGANNCLECPS